MAQIKRWDAQLLFQDREVERMEIKAESRYQAKRKAKLKVINSFKYDDFNIFPIKEEVNADA